MVHCSWWGLCPCFIFIKYLANLIGYICPMSFGDYRKYAESAFLEMIDGCGGVLRSLIHLNLPKSANLSWRPKKRVNLNKNKYFFRAGFFVDGPILFPTRNKADQDKLARSHVLFQLSCWGKQRANETGQRRGGNPNYPKHAWWQDWIGCIDHSSKEKVM